MHSIAHRIVQGSKRVRVREIHVFFLQFGIRQLKKLRSWWDSNSGSFVLLLTDLVCVTTVLHCFRSYFEYFIFLIIFAVRQFPATVSLPCRSALPRRAEYSVLVWYWSMRDSDEQDTDWRHRRSSLARACSKSW